MPDLSKALQTDFDAYLRMAHVNPAMVEHVCQMTHFEEHQRYLRWLHQLSTWTR